MFVFHNLQLNAAHGIVFMHSLKKKQKHTNVTDKNSTTASQHAVHAFYPQPGVCTPPGCSHLHGTRPPTAAAALIQQECAPRDASSPAARSPDAAGRSAGRRSRHGRCSDPPHRSAGRRSPAGYSGRAGTPGGHHPTSSLAGAGQAQHKGGPMGHEQP